MDPLPNYVKDLVLQYGDLIYCKSDRFAYWKLKLNATMAEIAKSRKLFESTSAQYGGAFDQLIYKMFEAEHALEHGYPIKPAVKVAREIRTTREFVWDDANPIDIETYDHFNLDVYVANLESLIDTYNIPTTQPMAHHEDIPQVALGLMSSVLNYVVEEMSHGIVDIRSPSSKLFTSKSIASSVMVGAMHGEMLENSCYMTRRTTDPEPSLVTHIFNMSRRKVAISFTGDKLYELDVVFNTTMQGFWRHLNQTRRIGNQSAVAGVRDHLDAFVCSCV